MRSYVKENELQSKEAESPGEPENIAFVNSYHTILHDQEQKGSVKAVSATLHVPSLMLSRLITFMKDNFQCSVAQGKGSEVKIWRDGSKIYTIGRHKKDYKVPSFLIVKIIKRLNIPKTEWLATLKKSH